MDARFKKLLLIVFALTSISQAQVPNLIAYQGKIAKNGVTADGTYQLRFGVYDSPTGGMLLWSETQQVTTYYGIFNVLLGSSVPFPSDLFMRSELYLGIKVENESEMSPRAQFASTAFAFRAAIADSLGFASVTGEKIVDGSVESVDLALNSVTNDKITNDTITRDKISSAQVVKTLNGLTDDVILQAGANITINPSGNVLQISALSGGGSSSGGVNGQGVSGQIARWAGSNTLEGSNDITFKNSQIGMGTTTPYLNYTSSPPKVDVNGYLMVSNTYKRQISAYRWLDLSSNNGGQALLAANAYTVSDSLDPAKIKFCFSQTHSNIGAIGLGLNYPNWNQASFIYSDATATEKDKSFEPKVVAVFQKDGRVGIGTTRPRGKLDVKGMVYAEGIQFPDSSVQTSASGGGGGITGSGTADRLSVWTGTNSLASSTNLVWKNTNLGIGSTNPQFKLEVLGGIASMNDASRQLTTSSWADMSGNQTGYGLFAGNAYVSYSGGAKWKYANESKTIGAIGFATHYPSYNKASIIASPDTFSTKDLEFQPGIIATFTHDGRVGIGTATPTQKLEVNGTVYSKTGGFQFPDGTIQKSAAGIGGLTGQGASGQVAVWSAANGLLGSNDIFFKNSQIGVGTSTPYNNYNSSPPKVDVHGFLMSSNYFKRQLSAYLWADISSNGGGIALFGNNVYTSSDSASGTNKFCYSQKHNSIGAAGIALNFPSWSTAASIIVGDTSATEKDKMFTPKVLAVFQRDGNVGVGTTTPAAKLDVNGGIAGQALAARNNLGQDAQPAIGGVYADNVIYAWAAVNASGLLLKGMGCTVLKNNVGTYSIVLKRTMASDGLAPAITAKMTDSNPVFAAIKEINSTGFTVQLFKIANGAATLVDAPFYFNLVGKAY